MNASPYHIERIDQAWPNVWQVSGPGIEPRKFYDEQCDWGALSADQLAVAFRADLCAAHNAGWSAGQLALAKIHRELEQTKSVIADGTVGMKRGE